MTTRYWVIAPFDSTQPEMWEKVWQFDLANNVLSIGWEEIGNPSQLSESEIKDVLQKAYGGGSSSHVIWNFYHNIQLGDMVLARRGRKKIAAVGTVIKQAYFDKNKGREVDSKHSNYLDVHWHDSPRNAEFDRIILGMQTVHEISASQYQDLVGEQQQPVIVNEPKQDIEDTTEFVLEKYLEDFIVSNFAGIFRNELVLYRDPEENVIGQQYATDVGTIDILAQDPKTGNFTVIELKKGRESDKVVGQTLRYMGWVQENLCRGGAIVKGMIICKDIDSKMAYALKMTNNVEVKLYRVDFALRDTTIK